MSSLQIRRSAKAVPDIAALLKGVDPIVGALIRSMPAPELLRYAPMPEAARLSGVSLDTLERHYADKIIDLSPRRKGMRVIHALLLRTSPGARMKS